MVIGMTERTTLDAEEWISPGEAAGILGVTTKTVARFADDGRIRFIRPGAHRRYAVADIAAIVAQDADWSPAS